MTHPAHSAHHPGWREVREGFLADPDVQQAYRNLEPRFVIVRKLIELRKRHGWSLREVAGRFGV